MIKKLTFAAAFALATLTASAVDVVATDGNTYNVQEVTENGVIKTVIVLADGTQVDCQISQDGNTVTVSFTSATGTTTTFSAPASSFTGISTVNAGGGGGGGGAPGGGNVGGGDGTGGSGSAGSNG